MKTTIIVLIGLLIATTTAQAKDYTLAEGRALVKKWGVDYMVQLTLEAANQMLPAKVDDYTTVGKQQYLKQKKIVVCHYMLDIQKLNQETTAKVKRQLFTRKVNRRCGNNFVYMENGVSYQHLYEYADGTPLFRYEVSIKDCK